jgi:eukaryotic-like serine/threonine-protein kinase
MSESELIKLALKTPEAERSALLNRECADNHALRERIEELFNSPSTSHILYERVDKLTQTQVADYLQVGLAIPGIRQQQTGAVLGGKYTLLELIAEGGMGAVWRAKQSEPVKRLVAVKLIKLGMDSKEVLARFATERQALAMMDHPNIAKVFDAGMTSSTSEEEGSVGQPYFVMELVKGIPITDYCDQLRLSPRERLELFIQACNALQHAHQKGIIHRDIKPSNVLVALYDGKPVVKVIDFGVAKATAGELRGNTFATGFDCIVGTPEYMSPEQASFNNLDVDTRTWRATL